MPVPNVSHTDYAIDLSSDAAQAAPENVREALSALDENGDGQASSFESQEADLPAPASGIDIHIHDANDLAFYDELLQNAFNAAPYARFTGGKNGRITGFAEAEARVIALHDGTITPGLEAKWKSLTGLGHEVLSGNTRFFFYKDAPGGDGFYFSVNFPADLNSGPVTPITVEFNGESFYLADLDGLPENDFIGLKRDVLEFFLVVPMSFPSYVPKGFFATTRDYVEALNYQCGSLTPERLAYHDYVAPTQGPGGHNTPPDLRPDDVLKLKKSWVMTNKNPVVSTVKVQGTSKDYDIGLRGQGMDKAPLSSDELKTLETVLKGVPKPLYGVLDVNGIMTDFTVEVIEDDVFNYSLGSGGGGQYFSWLHKFVIRRSSLTNSKPDSLTELATHELGHGIFPNDHNSHDRGAPWYDEINPFRLLDQTMNGADDGFNPGVPWYDELNPFEVLPRVWDQEVHGVTINFTESRPKYFLNSTWGGLAERAKSERVFPSVSVYSLYSVAELLTECAVAYLTGESDPHPYGSLNGGPLSRAELREKLPELYLAMRLFFEPDNDYFGDLNVFTWAFKGFYDDVLASPQREHYLSADTPASDVAYAYDYVTYFGVMPPLEKE